MMPNSDNHEASSSANQVESPNLENDQFSGQDSVQIQEFIQNLKQVLHNSNFGIRQDLVNAMNELMGIQTLMPGPINQKSTLVIRNQMIEEVNANPMVLPMENQRLPPMVLNVRPDPPYQNHFNWFSTGNRSKCSFISTQIGTPGVEMDQG